jgi:ribosomal protein S18 acetylase RimI-like enzyme
MTATMMRWLECTAEQMTDALTVRRPGICALVSPALPESTVYNTVVYADSTALRGALGELGPEFARAGARSWSVLTHPGDEDVGAKLRRRGFRCPGGPVAMFLDLADLPMTDVRLDLVSDPTAEVAAEVNARAYGYPPGLFSRLFSGVPAGMTCYVAAVAGRPACTLQIVDEGEDAGLFGMATDPEFQRRGLASALLLHALHEAREQGCRSSTLQASSAGEPLYTSLGYRGLGVMPMWERHSR